MTRTRRWAAVALLGAALVGLGSAAGAAEADGCAGEDDGYVAGGVCELEVVAEAVCIGDEAYLAYALTLPGSTATTATATWENPDGDDVVLTGLPLTGQLAWPGDWARPSVDVTFDVNPSATVTVAYPGATAGCVSGGVSQVADEESGVLASTGFGGAAFLGAAGGLLVAGGVLVGVSRVRRSRGQD